MLAGFSPWLVTGRIARTSEEPPLSNFNNYWDISLQKLYDTIRKLKDAPHLGKIGRIEGTREILFPPMPYVAVYRVREQSIEVLRIWHTTQDRG